MPNDALTFNGINGSNGGYLLPALSAEQVSHLAQGKPLADDATHLKTLIRRHKRQNQEFLGVKEGVDATDLAQAGWGVVFAFADKDETPTIKEALEPLLTLRKSQAGALYREYTNDKAYRPGESAAKFLARHGASPAEAADPDRVPYYLLLVGSPESIPYRFQYQLDVQYAVGRLHFDTVEEYAQYARNVVAREEASAERLARKATFFAVQNAGDEATALSAKHLVTPLAEGLARHADWTVETIQKDDATKQRLTEIFHAEAPPALLFTASHGMGFQPDDPRQLAHQGALLCQDWPGPLRWPFGRAIPESHYFSADDVADDAQLGGLVAFHFACYGAGTPHLDDFAHRAFHMPEAIAPHAFVARLPRRMLAHPNGALAVIGHVERAWTFSFMWDNVGAQTTAFESTLERLVAGHPVGSAVEHLNDRYATLATLLSSILEDIKFGAEADDLELAGMWTAHNDARSYAILGDPAVRLNVAPTPVP